MWCHWIKRILKKPLGKECSAASNAAKKWAKIRATTTKCPWIYSKRKITHCGKIWCFPFPVSLDSNSHWTTYILFATLPSHLAPTRYKKLYHWKIFVLQLFILILEEGLAICLRMLSGKFSLSTWEPELLSVQTANTKWGMYLWGRLGENGCWRHLRSPQSQANSKIKFNIAPSAFHLKLCSALQGKVQMLELNEHLADF